MNERGVASNDGDWVQLATGGDGLRWIALRSDDLAGDSARGRVDYVELVAGGDTSNASRHPNGVQRIERAYIAVADLAGAVEKYAHALGAQPKMERGTVISADMAIFQLGPTAGSDWLGPSGPRVRDTLARGPGPFQVLYRRGSGIDAAVKSIADHGVRRRGTACATRASRRSGAAGMGMRRVHRLHGVNPERLAGPLRNKITFA